MSNANISTDTAIENYRSALDGLINASQQLIDAFVAERARRTLQMLEDLKRLRDEEGK